MTGIYTITSPTNKVYVGQSWNIFERVKDYKTNNHNNQRKLAFSIKKHGWSSHKFEIVLELRSDISQATLDTWEQYFMDLYRGQGVELMNLKEAGNYGKHSEESKKKMSITRKGRKHSKSHRANITKNIPRGENHPNYGKKRTPDDIAKQSIRLTGAGNPLFKGYILTYKDNILIGRYEGGYDAARKLGIKFSRVYEVLDKPNKSFNGYTFIRESLQK